ncbi:MAG: lignostilbene-alpha,beta-dioxygenase-like enzyme, partial [Mycobacterium sp.]|nr:lignostilbene-alpha,beta-dioxygenase-like enzyme [Mycobacterium sp.]
MDTEFNRQGVALPHRTAHDQHMTTAAPSRETVNPYLNGNFAPVREEITAIDLDVTGSLPTYLDGRYLRIGPNPIGDPDPAR